MLLYQRVAELGSGSGWLTQLTFLCKILYRDLSQRWLMSDFRVNPHKAMVTGWCEIALKWSYLRISPRGPWFSKVFQGFPWQAPSRKWTSKLQLMPNGFDIVAEPSRPGAWNPSHGWRTPETISDDWNVEKRLANIGDGDVFEVYTFISFILLRSSPSTLHLSATTSHSILTPGVTAVSHMMNIWKRATDIPRYVSIRQHLRWHFDVARGKVHLQNCEQSWRLWEFLSFRMKKIQTAMRAAYSCYTQFLHQINSPELHRGTVHFLPW